MNEASMGKRYSASLQDLVSCAARTPNTPLMAKAKVCVLVKLNMRYERLMVDRALSEHPYVLVERLIHDAIADLRAWEEVRFIEAPDAKEAEPLPGSMEESHQKLFQELWTMFPPAEYRARIERFVHRIRVNHLHEVISGARCIDFGSGHGNFAHALLREGAASVLGIDFGVASVRYAIQAQRRLGVAPERLSFRVESVYQVNEPDGSFDFAVQNGVFHHLEDEDRAYREVRRVLRPGGWFWIYTDGAGTISGDLWDASVEILKGVPQDLIIALLTDLNVGVEKRYHLGDGLQAVYRHATWEELTERLSSIGFCDFRRLTGGFDTDFDHDVIALDRYGPEKFGSGDLRLLARRR